eukprot:scaffold98724_cov17-Tisochrysis_lutea.AAC.1
MDLMHWQMGFADPSTASPAHMLINDVMSILGIPARLEDTSTGKIEGRLPDWWPEEVDLKAVEKAIREAVGATDGKAREG